MVTKYPKLRTADLNGPLTQNYNQDSTKTDDEQKQMFSDEIFDEVWSLDVEKTVESHSKASHGRVTEVEPGQVAREPAPRSGSSLHLKSQSFERAVNFVLYPEQILKNKFCYNCGKSDDS